MEKIESKQILWGAERLALFSNLRTAPEMDNFSRDHAEFFPRNFWNWRVNELDGSAVLSPVPIERQTIKFSIAFQRSLREAWQINFPLEECVRLISCAAVADRLFCASEVEPDLSTYPVFPYQRAVMLLCLQPWRARFCPECGTRFVADKPARRFCSIPCASTARRQTKKAWWSGNGNKWRSNYRNRKSKRKGKI
jgi:hypothetical protein